mgnify:CR=1 FL=1
MINYTPTDHQYPGISRRTILKGSAATAATIALSPLEVMAGTDKSERPLPDQVVGHIQNALRVTREGVSPQTYSYVSQAHYQPAVNMAREAANGKRWEDAMVYQALEAIALTEEAKMYSELASLNVVDPKGPKIHIVGLPDIYGRVKIASPTRVNNLLKALQNYERVEAIHKIANKQGKILPEAVYKEKLAKNGRIPTLENVYESMLKTLTWLDTETRGKYSAIIEQRKGGIMEKLKNLLSHKPSPLN